MSRLLSAGRLLKNHRYGLTVAVYLTAAVFTGAGCVLFMRGFEHALDLRFETHLGVWVLLATPAAFWVCAAAIGRFAPCAAGTGIPQAIFAAEHLDDKTEAALQPLTSLRTMAFKIGALYLAVAAGASTGREGPTVHVAVCLFVSLLLLARRWTGLKIDLRSAVVAGGSAGLAAAFNTPLAGLTFAIEELAGEHFAGFKDYVLLAIIAAALTAEHFTGDYLYFGVLGQSAAPSLAAVLAVGLCGGLGGAVFSEAIVRGRARLASKPWAAALGCGLAVAALSRLAGPRLFGPGNLSAMELVAGNWGPWAFWFAPVKLLATLLTYWAGIAGGIFAPCLSIGAALGSCLSQAFSVPVAPCAMVGMAAFLSGTIQAPITAFVVIYEMTGRREMLLPIMLGSLAAWVVARLLGARQLYHTLSLAYAPMLEQSTEKR